MEVRSLRKHLRRWLNRYGLLLFRPEIPPPPTLADYLDEVVSWCAWPGGVVCFDSEVQMQSDLLRVFGADRCVFYGGAGLVAPSCCCRLPQPPAGSFLGVVATDRYALASLEEAAPWFFDAPVLLLRCSLGFYWSGKGDLRALESRLERHGFKLAEALDYCRLQWLDAPLSRVVLAFVKEDGMGGYPVKRGAAQRVACAQAFLRRPIAQAAQLRWLAGRGDFGYAAGVLNPGAIEVAGRLVLVARAERYPWAVCRENWSQFMTTTQPLLMRLNSDFSIESAHEIGGKPAADMESSRREDFRLFQHAGQLYANYSAIRDPLEKGKLQRTLRLERLETRVGIAALDLQNERMEDLGTPRVDLPLGKTEKNWGFFGHQDAVYCIYSFQPYRVLKAVRWPELVFETVCARTLSLPEQWDCMATRNSVNPVEYDAEHYLHIVHHVYPGKHYVFWAVLIDKQSLLPCRISRHPLARGNWSAAASLIYVCAVVAQPEQILLLGGLDDSACGVWRIPRADLDADWDPLPGPVACSRSRW